MPIFNWRWFMNSTPPAIIGPSTTLPSHPGSPTEYKHDVFFSYRGAEVKDSFRSHLFQRLKEARIDYFWDDSPEGRGEKVASVIFGAIPSSRVALMLLSPRYADSKWCLDELVEILKCKRDSKVHDHGTILPIFYKVSTGDVKHQVGEFGTGFAKLKRKNRDKVKEKAWQDALIEVASIGGLRLQQDCNGDETILIGKILEWLAHRGIPFDHSSLGQGVVGRDQDAKDVISMFPELIRRKKVCVIIGISGMQNIGKTSLAKLVVSRIHREFRWPVFIENIRTKTKEDVVQKLYDEIVSTVNRGSKYDLEGRIDQIRRNLKQSKALVVFDDVDEKNKVKRLLRDPETFCPESIIIITARDERLLNELGVDYIYTVSALSTQGSVQLLRNIANNINAEPPQEDDYHEKLSANLCHYTGGLPREIKKLGSYLRKNTTTLDDWEMALGKLVRNPCIRSVIRSNPVKVGPYPESTVSSFADKAYTGVRQIQIATVGPTLESITIDYDQDGCLVRPGTYGGTYPGRTPQGKIHTIKLDFPREYLTSISGHASEGRNPITVVQSLKIMSNFKPYRPYGNGGAIYGTSFDSKTDDHAKIIGFHGNFGACLHSIGVYVELFSDQFPLKRVGPFGGQSGEAWDDEKHKDIRQIDVVFGSEVESISIRYDDDGGPTGGLCRGQHARDKLGSPVKLDWPHEYLTSITGYTTGRYNMTVISSVTLHSNRQSYGPFGPETGRPFGFPAKCGKIVGFYGTCLDKRLESIGVHYELVPHIYPSKTFGPFGGEIGNIWDDGEHAGIRKVTVKYDSVINYLSCVYHDLDGETVHGGDGRLYQVIDLEPDEHITSMCGYVAKETESAAVNSITLQTNRRIWGPFGKEKGTYFSLPLNYGKIVGFYGRTDGSCLTSIGAHFVLYSSKQYPFRSVGPFGGECSDGEKCWDDGRFAYVKQIEIFLDNFAVKRVKFLYETDDKILHSRPHGSKVKGTSSKITLNRDEYLTSFSGYLKNDGSCILSLTFQSNVRTIGPFGIDAETGKYFSAPATGGKIVGFFGRNNQCGDIISIGAHFEPISQLYPAKLIGPFGGQGGEFSFFHDKDATAVTQIRVCYDKNGIVRIGTHYNNEDTGLELSSPGLDERCKNETVTLDYPNEYLTTISGYVRDYPDRVVVRTLIFHTNKRVYGPYGKEKPKKGRFFWYPSTGSQIVSFYGSYSSSHLCSIGVYTKPLSHLYPFRSIGPFGGGQGSRWDDGIFTGVREIHVIHGSAIVAFCVEYDNNGSSILCDQHGNDRFQIAAGAGSAEPSRRIRLWPEPVQRPDLFKLDYPKEYVESISGTTGKKYGEEVVLSLTIKTNWRSKTYGTQKGNPFLLPQEQNCGRIIGFHGTSGRFLNSLGARLEPF